MILNGPDLAIPPRKDSTARPSFSLRFIFPAKDEILARRKIGEEFSLSKMAWKWLRLVGLAAMCLARPTIREVSNQADFEKLLMQTAAPFPNGSIDLNSDLQF